MILNGKSNEKGNKREMIVNEMNMDNAWAGRAWRRCRSAASRYSKGNNQEQAS